MGWYLRKSFRLGSLLRLNLSKGGLGASFGIPGFRVGAGPRGSYVHAGRGGVYYRKSLGSSRGAPQADSLREVESAEASELSPGDYAHIAEAVNTVHRRLALLPIVPFVAALIAWLLWFNSAPWPWFAAFAAIGGVVAWGAWKHDQTYCRLTLNVKMDAGVRRAFEDLKIGFQRLAESSAVWHVEAGASVRDAKRTAGVREVVRRRRIRLRIGQPPRLDTNVAVPTLPSGRQNLYLFPIGIFVFERTVGIVPYSELEPIVQRTRFVESDSVPDDVQVVDRTWQYVNKNGGPDRRFSNNPELPVVEYGELTLRSRSGLYERFQSSRPASMEQFAKALLVMQGAGLTKDTPAESPPAGPPPATRRQSFFD